MTSRTAALAGLWLVISALTLGAGLAAVRITAWVLEGSVVQPMSGREVERNLATRPAITPDPSYSVPDAGPLRVFSSPGGRVLVRCVGRDRVAMTGWSPSIGFHAQRVVSGPAAEVEVVFERDDGTGARTAVRCADGTARLTG
ncbi:hypothetical protein [Spirillospora sp. NPDC047279]|uniref:hypothetical protein n=1 Tax=Spirillospora sp. NPDC047279 TaxID=3155478 RepID=UPI003402C0EA